MINRCRLLWIFFIPLILFSCKNDIKETPSDSSLKKVDSVTRIEDTISKKERQEQATSVLSKIMRDPELMSFVRNMVTSGTADFLLKNKGPFTVLAPTNAAFSKLDTVRMETLLNPKNKEELAALMNRHIVVGNFDSDSLLESINSGQGMYTLSTISGDTLTVMKKGNDIIVKNSKGVKGVIGKSDIIGSNGVVHILDALLIMD